MRTRLSLFLALLLLVLVVAPPAVFADKIIFKNGRSFEGKLISETGTHYVFKVKGMGEQKFKKSDVLKIEKGESSFDLYEKRRKALKEDDAKGFYDLGEWCKKQGLMKEAKQCFRAAVKADPEHAPARRALGYVRFRGDWLTEKKYKKVAKEIEAKESEIIAGLKPAKEPVQDTTLRYMIVGPEGWNATKNEGNGNDEGVTIEGPELGSGPVTIRLAVDADGGELDKMVKKTLKDLTEEHDGLIQKGEVADITLAGQPGKMLVTAWTADDIQPWAVDVERRDFMMVADTGAYHLSIECVAGYYEKLQGTFDKVVASVKILAKQLDLMANEQGSGLSFPDENYEKGTFLPLPNLNFKMPDGKSRQFGLSREAVSIRIKNKATLFTVSVTKKEEGTTLDTAREAVAQLITIPELFQFAGSVEDRKVDGVDAKSGQFTMMNGGLAHGYWCVILKGDKVFTILFMNVGNQGVGRQYLKKDYASLLSGFKFL